MRTTTVLLLVAFGLLGQDAPLASWSGTTPLTEARSNACAVRLNDGRVLVAGGTGVDGPLASVELYQADATFASGAPMLAARSRHNCVLLVDGRVLVVGGEATGVAELYDPVADTWQAVDGIGQPRAGATATLLRDRRVLIAGGSSPDGTALASLEVFSPQDNTLTPLDSTLSVARDAFAAVRQSDGTVLFIGGTNADGVLSSTDLFSPVDDSVTAGPVMNVARTGHSATLLLDERILVAGGFDGNLELDSAELYDPAIGAFVILDARMQTARRDHLAIFIAGNGGVLLAGGRQGDQALVETDLFQPLDATFLPLGNLTAPRFALAGALISDGVILATGGLNPDGPQVACGVLLVPSITFSKGLYRPGDLVQLSGSNFRPNANLALSLQLLAGTVVARVDSRLLTRAVTVPGGGQFQILNGFPSMPILNTNAGDNAKTVRVIAQLPDGSSVQATAPIRLATAITFTKPDGQYEGFHATLLSQLTRTSGGAPITGSFAFSVPSNSPCLSGGSGSGISDGTSNTILISESATSGITGTLTLSGNMGDSILSPSISVPGTGPVKLIATYTGDAGNDPAAASGCFTPISRASSVQLAPPAGTIQAGSAFNLSAQVQVADGTPKTPLTGTVTFSLDGFPLPPPSRGQPRTTSFGTFTQSQPFTPLSVGTLSFSAQYVGDSFFGGASSNAVSVNVQKATTTLSLVNPPATFHCNAPFSTGVQLNFPPVLGLANTSVSLSGQTRQRDGSVHVQAIPGTGTLTVTSPGVATGTLSVAGIDTSVSSIMASFNGDALLQGSSTPFSFVTLATSPVTVTVDAPPSAEPNPVTLLIRVAPQGCATSPTGNLEILDGGVPVTVVTVEGPKNTDTNAIVVTVTLSRPSGSHSIQAQYSGDRVYQPATSAPATVIFQ